MRLQYKLRGLMLALLLGACGRIDVDLLPEGEHTDPPLDAQARIDVEDGAVADSDDVGVGMSATDASANEDAGASEDGSARNPADSGAAPNVPVEVSGPVDAAVPDAATTSPAGVDAATPAADAGADAAARDAGAPDGGARDAGADAATPPCAGEALLGSCWYLGAANTSCNQLCSTHGGFDTNANSYVGSSSQGGSLANCQRVLSALGASGTAASGRRPGGPGLGCHIWSDGQPWWLTSPDATPDVAIPEARIACGCKR